MDKHISASILLILLLTSSMQAQQREWVKVAPLGAGLSFSMPIQPTEAVETKEQYTTHSFIATTGTTVLVVAYADYAPNVKMNNQAAELTGFRDSFLRGVNAQMTSNKEIKLDGRPGLEFTGEDDRSLYKIRVYIFGNRIQQIGSVTLKGNEDTETVDRFFASFTFTATTGAHGKP